ncbi:hypothetical protein DPMN_067271 [Dreissena polymorpha]|uniref:Uncharacterized protein n=1 Tax=Dreissena polymorpha TaxID=45954 RepID=A0A9D4BVP9_DREPO|nr:hypothetical protein DPMN_067271 [Dreissena polymorpha]
MFLPFLASIWDRAGLGYTKLRDLFVKLYNGWRPVSTGGCPIGDLATGGTPISVAKREAAEVHGSAVAAVETAVTAAVDVAEAVADLIALAMVVEASCSSRN